MDKKEETKQIEERVLGAIERGEVKMRPRWQFVLRAVLAALGGILAFLIVIFLVSFIVFELRETGVWFAPLFGAAGWRLLFLSLPWLLILFSLIFLAAAALLAEKHSLVYKRPLVYSLAGILGLTVLGGALVAATPFHRGLFESARRGELPVLGLFYRGFGPGEHPDIHRGTVYATTTGGFIEANVEGETSTVVLGPRMAVLPEAGLNIGEAVVVFGRENPGNIIEASAVRIIGQ